MFLLWHPSLTAINLSYTFPIFETSATALCGTTGIQSCCSSAIRAPFVKHLKNLKHLNSLFHTTHAALFQEALAKNERLEFRQSNYWLLLEPSFYRHMSHTAEENYANRILESKNERDEWIKIPPYTSLSLYNPCIYISASREFFLHGQSHSGWPGPRSLLRSQLLHKRRLVWPMQTKRAQLKCDPSVRMYRLCQWISEYTGLANLFCENSFGQDLSTPQDVSQSIIHRERDLYFSPPKSLKLGHLLCGSSFSLNTSKRCQKFLAHGSQLQIVHAALRKVGNEKAKLGKRFKPAASWAVRFWRPWSHR